MKTLDVYFNLLKNKNDAIHDKNYNRELIKSSEKGKKSGAMIRFFFVGILVIISSFFIFNHMFQNIYDISTELINATQGFSEDGTILKGNVRLFSDILFNHRDLIFSSLDAATQERYFYLIFLKSFFIIVGFSFIFLSFLKKIYFSRILVIFMVVSLSLTVQYLTYPELLYIWFNTIMIVHLIISSVVFWVSFDGFNKSMIPAFYKKEKRLLESKIEKSEEQIKELNKDIQKISKQMISDENIMNEVLCINYKTDLHTYYSKKYENFNSEYIKELLLCFKNEEQTEEQRMQNLINERFQCEKIINN